jgi:hypothetical protein
MRTSEFIKFASLRENVGDFLKGDEKGLDWRYGLFGGAASNLTSGAVNAAYLNSVFFPATRTPTDPADISRYSALEGRARNLNLPIRDPKDTNLMRLTSDYAQRGKNPFLRAFAKMSEKSIAGAPGFYSGPTNEIGISKRFASPGVLAHELGHAEGGKALLKLNRFGKLGMLGAPMALFSPDEDVARAGAIGGTALMAGTLASEADASRRGYQMLRGLGAGRRGALKAFAGLPTYLLAAGAPAGAYLGKKHLGGFDKSPPPGSK